MEKILYEWQSECLERWLSNHGRGMVQAVTGSGKTLLALEAIKKLEQTVSPELRIKIVVPTGALMHQWNKALRNFLADSGKQNLHPQMLQKQIGLRGNGRQDAADHKYMIYIINSARYELARQILAELKAGIAVFLIADECHHYDSTQNRLIFEFVPYIKQYESRFFSLGLSATLPSGQAQKYLSSVLGQKIYNYKIDNALASNTISPFDIYHISLSFQKEEREEYYDLTDKMVYLYRWLIKKYPCLKEMSQKERFEMLRTLAGGKDKKAARTAALYMQLSYKRKRLVNLASARCGCAFDLVKNLDENEKIIIFGERIQQAEKLYMLLQKQYPGKTGRYHSQMGEQANQNTLERFRNGDIRILIACKAIDEGVDVPDASVGIILSSTSTMRQRIQRLGRIVRKNTEKEKASLYYLHIGESSEDVCYLPDAGESRLFELEYFPETHEFYNSPYNHRAEELLDSMQTEDIPEEKQNEILRCLCLGSVRADWMLDETEITSKIQNAAYTRDKNYWICMKKLHKLKI